MECTVQIGSNWVISRGLSQVQSPLHPNQTRDHQASMVLVESGRQILPLNATWYLFCLSM